MITPHINSWLSVIPVVIAIKCHQDIPPGIPGIPLYIEADVCAITYSFSKINFQSGVTNFAVTPGCYGNGSPKTVCFCKSDLCNSNDFAVTKLNPLTNASCRDPITAHWCDSPTCLFTTVKDIDFCRTYDEPLSLHDLIDQSSITFSGNSTIKPTSSFVANCESNNNLTCQGHFCYMESQFVSGCLTIVDDSLATRKPAVNSSYYQFLLLEFYLCTEVYCNVHDVYNYRENQLTKPNATEVESTTKAVGCNSHRIGLILAIIAMYIVVEE